MSPAPAPGRLSSIPARLAALPLTPSASTAPAPPTATAVGGIGVADAVRVFVDAEDF